MERAIYINVWVGKRKVGQRKEKSRARMCEDNVGNRAKGKKYCEQKYSRKNIKKILKILSRVFLSRDRS